MRYIKIKKDMYLIEQPVERPEGDTVQAQTNHVWIYDRSYSMYRDIKGLCEDLKERTKQIPLGDTLSLGWFSSMGEYNWVIKGFKVTENADREKLEKAIDQNNDCIGATCYSEILLDTEQVIKDLGVFSTNFALCFFTDGYPNNEPRRPHEKCIMDAIDHIKGSINSAMFVGYGNYYNKELMTRMAERIGGALVHSNTLGEFSVALQTLVEDSGGNSGKIEVELDDPRADLIFGINKRQINIYQAEKGRIQFVPSKKGDNAVYMLTDQVPYGYRLHEEITENELTRPTKLEPLVKAAYAAAFVLTQKTKTDQALDILGYLGDVALIDAVSNAYTNEEYGKAEARIKRAVTQPKKGRLTNGYDPKYLPKEDAFCLLDALDILMRDREACFYPYNKNFVYHRIGAGAQVKEGYPTFKARKSVECPISSMVWNEKFLNLSIRATIPGTVDLPKGHAELGLTKVYPTAVYRNYALVKDGFCNVSTLPVSLSKDSFQQLKAADVINASEKWKDGGIYTLHLDRIPVINRAIANGKTSAKELCKKAFQEASLKAQLKVLKAAKTEIDPDGDLVKSQGLTTEQETFLEQNGIKRGIFSPPTEKLPSTDSYQAKEFTLKIKGLSSLPKVEDVKEKIKEKKKLNTAAQLMKSGLDLVKSTTAPGKSDKAKVTLLDEVINDVNGELLKVRNDIQATKFAIILGKKWFDEFDSRGENKLTVGDNEFTIGVREVEVEF